MTYSVLGIDTHTGQRVEIHKSFRLQGLAIIGLQGTGKTVLVKHLLTQDMKQGIGICLLDLHGDLTNDALSLIPADQQKDVIYLDLTDYRYPFGINLFTCADPSNPEIVSAAASRVMHIFKRLWGKGGVVVEDAWGVTLEELLWNTTLTFLEASKDTVYTMAEIPLFLTDRAFRNRVVSHITNRHVKDYWLRRYNLLSEKDQRDETRSTLNRINAFLTQPLVEGIVGQARTTIDFRSVMDERKKLLIKLSKRHEGVSALIGSLVIAEFLNAAYSRADLPVQKRKQFHIYADEAQNYATEDFATLLEEARKFGMGVTYAHQNLGQITFSLRERIRSVPNRAVFKVNSTDAAALAGEFDITPAPERLEEIEKEQLIGHRPVRTYKGDVIGHLLHQGREDERVTAFRDDYLEKLHLHSLKKSERGFGEVFHPINHLGIAYNPERLLEPLAALNSWLHAGMRQRDLLWKPLDFITLSRLSDFFGFKLFFDAFHSTLYRDQPWHKIGQWHDPGLKLHKDVWYDYGLNPSGDSMMGQRGNTQAINNAAVEAVEDSLIGFIATQQPEAAVRRVWQQKAIALTENSVTDVLDRGLAALAQITGALRAFAETHPALDRTVYMRCFLAELSKPEQALEVFLPVITHAGHEATRDLADYSIPRSAPAFSKGKAEIKTVGIHDPQLYKLALYQKIVELMPSYLSQFPAFLHFFATLHCAQLALCQDPILTTDSGMYEQDKRTQTHYIMHAQRAYADRLNEVASELTNLPLYTARVRLMTEAGSEEHTIRTLDPKEQADRPLFGQALQARLERIREQNIQDGYVRERAAVEEEIRQRQEQYREPPEEPPISRRPPR